MVDSALLTGTLARGMCCGTASFTDLSTPCRKTLADYLKDLRSVEGGDRQLTSWLKEEGFQTSLRTINQVGASLLLSDIAVDNNHTGCISPSTPRSALAKGRVKFHDAASLKSIGQ